VQKLGFLGRYFGAGPPADTPLGNIDRLTETPDTKPRVPYYDGRLFTVNSRYHPLIEKVSATHDVDEALVKAVVQAESAFDSEALSRDGAQGLMQVLPTTAARYSIDNLSDPHQNLQAGVRHLKRLLKMFKGNVPLALAAYNAGENAVKRFDGIPPYEETLAYVGKVLGLWKLYARQLSLYPPMTLLSQSHAGIPG
jgi:soluble lytic murein transglycosylase-like protein